MVAGGSGPVHVWVYKAVEIGPRSPHSAKYGIGKCGLDSYMYLTSLSAGIGKLKTEESVFIYLGVGVNTKAVLKLINAVSQRISSDKVN